MPNPEPCDQQCCPDTTPRLVLAYLLCRERPHDRKQDVWLSGHCLSRRLSIPCISAKLVLCTVEPHIHAFNAAQKGMHRAFEYMVESADAALRRERALIVDLERSADNAETWRQQRDSMEMQLRDADCIKEHREQRYAETAQALSAAQTEVIRLEAALQRVKLSRADEGKEDNQSPSSSCPEMYVL